MWMLILMLSTFAAEPEVIDVNHPEIEAPQATTHGDLESTTPPEVNVPTTDAEAMKAAKEGLDAYQAGQYGLLGALVLGLLVFLYNRFFSKPMAAPPSA